MNSTALDAAVSAAGRAQLALYGLMAAHGITHPDELRLLLAWPAGMQDAYKAWFSAMSRVVNELGHAEGIERPAGLSERDKIRLTMRAYQLVIDTPFGGDARSRLLTVGAAT